jgi:hypothetical protein
MGCICVKQAVQASGIGKPERLASSPRNWEIPQIRSRQVTLVPMSQGTCLVWQSPFMSAAAIGLGGHAPMAWSDRIEALTIKTAKVALT